MPCVNIIDHRQHCTKDIDAVFESLGQTEQPDHAIHEHRIVKHTTVQEALRRAQRSPKDIILFLYSPGTIQGA